jgi:hypothetical protein
MLALRLVLFEIRMIGCERLLEGTWHQSALMTMTLFSYSGLQQPNKSSILKDGIYVIAQVHSRIARSLPLFRRVS